MWETGCWALSHQVTILHDAMQYRFWKCKDMFPSTSSKSLRTSSPPCLQDTSKIAQIFLPCQPWFIIPRTITPNLHTLHKNYFFYKGKFCLHNCVEFTSAMNPNTASKLHWQIAKVKFLVEYFDGVPKECLCSR